MMRTLTVAAIFVMASILPGTKSHRVAEVFFVVDQKVVSQYLSFGATSPADAKLKIRADTEFLLTEVNKILQALSVELRVRRLDILDTDIFSDCETKNNQSVHQDFGLYSFDKYIRNNTLYAHLDYDMAILLTGYNIYGKDNWTAGIARNGKVCQEEGIGILEYIGTYHEVPSIAHEVSLILGLHHDVLTCSDGYVMDYVMDPSSGNRWSFSPCSLENIGELIQSHACLNHTNPNSKKPDSLPTGDILDMDKMCRRWMRDARSYMCKNERFYNGAAPHGDNVCQQVYCKVPGKYLCVKGYPTDGMVCAEGNKRCSMGKCSAAPDNNPVATQVDNSCVFGDKATLHLKGNSTTCAALMAKPENSRYCYDDDSRKMCCETCKSKKTSQPGCMYGDKHLINLTVNGSTQAISCSAYLTPARTGNCYRDDMQDACCESCEKRKNPAKPDCMYGDKIRLTPKNATEDYEPLTCPEFLAKEGKSKCYRENIQAGCCETCEKHMDPSKPDCLFGDKITFTLKNATTPSKPLTCPEFIAQEGTRKCYKDNIQAGCCETCGKHKNPSKPECLFGDKTLITVKSSPEPVTCSAFLPSENKVQCYRDEIEDACCDSCEKHKDPSMPDCQYGDRSKDCIKYSRDILCPSKLYAAICCEHCSGWKGKRSTLFGSHLGGVKFSALDRSPLATLFEDTAGILPQLDDVITQYHDVGMIAK